MAGTGKVQLPDFQRPWKWTTIGFCRYSLTSLWAIHLA